MEQRRNPRFRASFPVQIEPEGGVMIDMSSSGIAFETEHDYAPGEEIRVRIVLGRKGGGASAVDLECAGRVLRVTRTERGFRVAATVEWIEQDGIGGMATISGT